MIFISLLLGFKGGLITLPWFSQRIKGLFCLEKLCFMNLYKFFSNEPAALLTVELILLVCKIKLCCVRHLVTLPFTITVQGKIHQFFFFFKNSKETKLRDSSWCLKAEEPKKHFCYLLYPDYALAAWISFFFLQFQIEGGSKWWAMEREESWRDRESLSSFFPVYFITLALLAECLEQAIS